MDLHARLYKSPQAQTVFSLWESTLDYREEEFVSVPQPPHRNTNWGTNLLCVARYLSHHELRFDHLYLGARQSKQGAFVYDHYGLHERSLQIYPLFPHHRPFG